MKTNYQQSKRYCKNCRRTTLFTDTNIRRHNANGKNIYRFAIYKCPKNHTWNQKLHIYKSFTDHVETVDMAQQEQTETSTPFPLHNTKKWYSRNNDRIRHSFWFPPD